MFLYFHDIHFTRPHIPHINPMKILTVIKLLHYNVLFGNPDYVIDCDSCLSPSDRTRRLTENGWTDAGPKLQRLSFQFYHVLL